MNFYYQTIFVLSLFASNGYGQTITNGDFEISNLSTCLFNSSNNLFNSSVSHAWSIGNNTSSGIDIQKSPCGYASAPSNLWFASLAKNNIFGTSNWATDELSLEIDVNLVAGNTYQISYYDYASSLFGSNIIPLQIGLSLDSTRFGDSIYSSIPSIDSWGLKTFNFAAPNNGKYLTVRNENKDTLSGWNFIDNFHFNTISGFSDLQNSVECTLYPSPFQNILNIKGADNEQTLIILYDIFSTNRLQETFTNFTTINTEGLAKGIYLYEVRSRNGIIKKGKVIKE